MLSPSIFCENSFYPIAVALVFSQSTPQTKEPCEKKKFIFLTSHSKLAILVQQHESKPIVLRLLAYCYSRLCIIREHQTMTTEEYVHNKLYKTLRSVSSSPVLKPIVEQSFDPITQAENGYTVQPTLPKLVVIGGDYLILPDIFTQCSSFRLRLLSLDTFDELLDANSKDIWFKQNSTRVNTLEEVNSSLHNSMI